VFEKKNLFYTSFATLAVWMLIGIVGSFSQMGSSIALNKLVEEQITLSFIIAPLFLLSVVFLSKGSLKVGFNPPKSFKSLFHLWLPLLFILAFLFTGISKGLPPNSVVVFILINTLLVGVSEELMFRGILFGASLTKFSIWKSIWIASIIFGVIHLSNGFLTGDFTAASVQAMQAIFAGVWFLAIRIRTGSIFPVIIIHGLWDFSIFIMSWGVEPTALPEQSLISKFLPHLLLELPLFLYAMWLLRKVGKMDKAELV